MSNNIETNTDASRILFIDSKDGINTSNDPQLTTSYKINLEDAIVVPNHHTLLLSLHRLNVPRTFYNFQHKRNSGLEVVFLNFDGSNNQGGTGWTDAITPANNRPPYLSFEIDEGNYDAISLMNLILTRCNDYLRTGKTDPIRQPHGAVEFDTEPSMIDKFVLEMNYNRDSLKYEFSVNATDPASPPAVGIMVVFRWKSGEIFGSDATGIYKDTSIRQECGFISNKWFNGETRDFYIQHLPNTTASSRVWRYGRGSVGTTYPLDGSWARTEVRAKTGLTATQIDNERYFFRGNGEWSSDIPPTQENYLSAVDVNYHTQNLYLHTSITQHSVLDTRIGGRFSNILSRIPVNVDSGEAVVVAPSDGSVHKLMLKVREITSIDIRLTDLDDKLIDTNGLDWTFSIEFDFIVSPQTNVKPDFRKTIEDRKLEAHLRATGKDKELKQLLERRNNQLLPMV